MSRLNIAQIGIDSPLRKLFDYRVGKDCQDLKVGMRVLVPFGKRTVVGIVVNFIDQSDIPTARLKTILNKIDEEPLFDTKLFALISWAARYYQYPLGPALFTALPPALRKTASASNSNNKFVWVAIEQDTLTRAPKQKEILDWLHTQTLGTDTQSIMEHFPNSRSALAALAKRGLIEKQQVTLKNSSPQTPKFSNLKLNTDQAKASKELISHLNTFQVCLLEGVTGSGKTEVYFSVIEKILALPKAQVLILVPEIGLTPQLYSRLENHFGIDIALLHSNTTDKQRKETWLNIKSGKQRIILGTRLAVFTRMQDLQLIIIDEEHDPSFKQQEGFPYHARDVAIYRAKQWNVPIILGSATPSFESLQNVQRKKFQHLTLPKRAHSEHMPNIKIADMRALSADNILSPKLVKAMHEHLQKGQQVILFLNRRGYAPALLCHDCGWVAQCGRCDANMVYHTQQQNLHCHHCDSITIKPIHCPECNSTNLMLLGHGTQKVEETIEQTFPGYSLIRLDRDNTKRKGSLEKILKDIREQKHQIIIGTQILSKGHDFPNVSLVGILDIDYGIYSADFRALERTAQLLIQVAGRSGRRNTQGEVYVQTHNPDHPLLNSLLSEGYSSFAKQALHEREEWQLPPYSYQISLRARGQTSANVYNFLERIKVIAKQIIPNNIQIQGPISPTMERKAGQYRAFILLTSKQRGSISKYLDAWFEKIEQLPEAKKVRWSIDVDPIDSF
ncbi:MAG: primosomal protein N' [Pseudomonadota bacterium]